MKVKEKIDFPLESFVDPLLTVEDEKPIPSAVTEAMPSDVVEIAEDLECLLLPTEQEDSIPVETNQLPLEIVGSAEEFIVGDSEDNYHKSELARQAQPIIERELTQLTQVAEQKATEEIEKIKTQEKIRYNKKLLEVSDAVQGESDYELAKLRRRRKRRKIKEAVSVCFWVVAVTSVVGYCYGNKAIRTRIVVVYNDIVELVKSWGSGEGKPSNKLVDDLLQPLGSELNEINGYDKGFTIDEVSSSARMGYALPWI